MPFERWSVVAHKRAAKHYLFIVSETLFHSRSNLLGLVCQRVSVSLCSVMYFSRRENMTCGVRVVWPVGDSNSNSLQRVNYKFANEQFWKKSELQVYIFECNSGKNRDRKLQLPVFIFFFIPWHKQASILSDQ